MHWNSRRMKLTVPLQSSKTIETYDSYHDTHNSIHSCINYTLVIDVLLAHMDWFL